MSKHTPEPWSVEKAQNGFIINARQRMYDVAVVRNIGNEDNEANAARIVACVNYCAGMTNEQLSCDSAEIVREELDRVTAELEQVQAELAALRKELA